MWTCIFFLYYSWLCRYAHVCVCTCVWVCHKCSGRPDHRALLWSSHSPDLLSLPPLHSWRRVNTPDQMPAIPAALTLLPHSLVTTVLPFLYLDFVVFWQQIGLQKFPVSPSEVRRIQRSLFSVVAPPLTFVDSCPVSRAQTLGVGSSHIYCMKLKELSLCTQ